MLLAVCCRTLQSLRSTSDSNRTMQPTRSNILDFIAFIPDADQTKAILFVEVCTHPFLSLQSTNFVESANSINEAVDRYYEDPNRYSNRPFSSMDNSIAGSTRSSAESYNLNQAMAIMVSTRECPPAVTSCHTSAGSLTSPRQSFGMCRNGAPCRPYENSLTKAAKVRSQDESEIQKMLHSVQLSCRIYNSEIEPEHETHLLCDCPVHKYWKKKFDRLGVLEMWSKAVIYPGEKPYHEFSHLRLSNNNPYTSILSPYTLASASLNGIAKPDPEFHARFVRQTTDLDAVLNDKAQAAIEIAEPSVDIWRLEQLESLVSDLSPSHRLSDHGDLDRPKSSKRSTLRKAFSVKSSDERTALKIKKKLAGSFNLRNEILNEELSRWQDEIDRNLVSSYQEHIGIAQSVAVLRIHKPLQYLHLLRAGYFEPIPIAWQDQTSNPLRFTINSSAGWRGVTPTWRGYKNTAEERLYWTLKHKLGAERKTKSDLMPELDTARERMALTVEVHPQYHSPDDICHDQYPSARYSKQIKPLLRTDLINKLPTDETIILLDVRGSMNASPLHPNYKQYLITGFSKSDQPKHQGESNIPAFPMPKAYHASIELAKAVLRRFVKALGKHDKNAQGYALVTFSSQAEYIDTVSGWNLDEVWSGIRFGGLSRVMAGWQKIKEMHFQKHSETATYHSTYGWQAGPRTPKLRLLLIFGSEFNDMDEFELTLLDASWAYITIFLIGIDDCPHHHRRAKRLRRMVDSNQHLSLVEAQGLVPERFVTHELLKCHLGQELSISEFENLEQQPAELPCPLGPRTQGAQSSHTQLEQVLIELPSTENTRTWQTDAQYPNTPGLHELQ
jgi:hypothetical protein